ncbi:MAG: molybdate ABC transporter substrate-binding protein [Longimicrobiales bacterium]|nr:molybdate ABC transporter substrate-binding protein [Longimicrobiales bacterium]
MSSSFLPRLALCLSPLVACCADEPADDDGGAPGSKAEVVVSAAASLTDAFAEIQAVFEASHPDIEIILNLAGSATLSAQILEGAPVDVFASADAANMELVASTEELMGEPRLFAGNALKIVVPPRNPAAVRGLGDFAREDLLLGLCRREVPCGRLAREVLAREGVSVSIDTAEPDVRALLTKVASGELDAAITYATDAFAAGEDVDAVDIPAEENVVTRYPIAVLARTRHPTSARTFVDFVLSPRGEEILERNGFLAP